MDLYNTIESFSQKLHEFTHMCIVKSLHYDDVDEKIGLHFNAYLYNSIHKKQTETLHFYVDTSKVIDITVIKCVVASFIDVTGKII
jgi:hypothetical protein